MRCVYRVQLGITDHADPLRITRRNDQPHTGFAHGIYLSAGSKRHTKRRGIICKFVVATFRTLIPVIPCRLGFISTSRAQVCFSRALPISAQLREFSFVGLGYRLRYSGAPIPSRARGSGVGTPVGTRSCKDAPSSTCVTTHSIHL